VIVSGRASSAQRLTAARALGLETAGEPEELRVAVARASGGRGADMAIDTTGSGQALDLAVEALRVRGSLLALGLAGSGAVSWRFDEAVRKSLAIVGSMSSAYEAWDAALELLASGAVDAEALVTEFALRDWRAAFDAVEGRNVIKAVLRPSEERDQR
jgi:threonine dehydrogenase-like Zn-dependent dehydrogenase